jgi:hypothetical protein
MVWLFPIWLALFLIALGCGLLVSMLLPRLGGPRFRAPLDTFQVFWFGYAFIIMFLELYSLVMPIRWPVLLLLGVLALAGFIQARGVVRRRLVAWRARPRLTLALGLTALLIVILAAAHAARPVGWYDTFLYHLQVVKWARQYPAVPGIANLHYRLAYNNSVHLFGALGDTFWRGRGAHFPVGILAIVTTLQLLNHALRPARGRARLLAAYSLLTLPFVAAGLASGEMSSLSSDLPLNLMCIVIGLELLALRGRRGDHADLCLSLILALGAVATTTKLGGVGMLVVGAVVAVVAIARGLRGAPGPARFDGVGRRIAGLALLPTLVLLGYFARQIVLSGWLLFPAPIGNLHLSWSLPEAETLEQFRWIQSWARIPGSEPADVLDSGLLRWLQPWYEGFAGSHEFVVLALACALSLFRLMQGKQRPGSWHVAALAAAVLSLVVWFRGAPDLRFGAGFFWLLLAVVAAPLLAEAMEHRSGRLLGLVLSLGFTYWTGGLTAALPHPDYWVKLPAIAPTKLREVELGPGVKATVPAGDSDRCGNAPLPCTPYPKKQRLRRANDLRYGYEF